MTQTNWHIITGAPSSGITSLGNYLRFMGFKVIPEVARGLIDIGHSRNLSTQDIRADQVEFERNIVKFQSTLESQLDPNEHLFIERGLLDCEAYGLSLDEILPHSRFRYHNIFFLESLNFAQDYARIENFAQAKQLGEGIKQIYLDQNYTLISIEKMPLAQRADCIVDHCSSSLYKPINLPNIFSK